MSLVIGAALLSGLYAAQQLTQGEAARSSGKRLAVAQSHLLGYINERRGRAGLRPVRDDPVLRDLASRHARDMLRNDYFAHDEPNGKTFFERIEPLHRRLGGETLSWGTGSFGLSWGIISLWMASPEHRKILLTPGMRRIGVAVFQGGPYYQQSTAIVAVADISS